MNTIIINYKGWNIKKFDKGFAAVNNVAIWEFRISEYKKKLEDIFFYCDLIDLQIERDKIEGRYEA